VVELPGTLLFAFEAEHEAQAMAFADAPWFAGACRVPPFEGGRIVAARFCASNPPGDKRRNVSSLGFLRSNLLT
jgi:hypothetical protein